MILERNYIIRIWEKRAEHWAAYIEERRTQLCERKWRAQRRVSRRPAQGVSERHAQPWAAVRRRIDTVSSSAMIVLMC